MADETGPQDALTGVYENPTTGALERRKIRTTDDGAALVQPTANGSPLAVAALPAPIILIAKAAAPVSTTGYPAYADALAAKDVRVSTLGVALAANDAVAVYCGTDTDAVAAEAVLNAYVAKLTTPGAIYPPNFPNCKVITLYDPIAHFSYDGTNLLNVVLVRRVTGAGTDFNINCQVGV